MKTSNKILLGLLVIVFAVPFLIASSLIGNMKSGEYTVEHYNNNNNNNTTVNNYRSGSFNRAKVIKIVAPEPGLMQCHLRLADTMTYHYNSIGSDSILVFTANDTLYIKYPGQKKE